MNHECEVYFELSIADVFDPEEVTRSVGIRPTSTVVRGELGQRRSQVKSRWTLSTGRVDSAAANLDVGELVARILTQLAPAEGKLIAVRESLGLRARLQVVLCLSSAEDVSLPAFWLAPESLQFLSRLGAELDVDLGMLD